MGQTSNPKYQTAFVKNSPYLTKYRFRITTEACQTQRNHCASLKKTIQQENK